MNTFNDKVGRNLYHIIHKYIKGLYKMKKIYTIKEITDYVKEYINMNEKIIYLALHDMIQRKITIYYNNIQGYIIYNNNYYIFQPSNNSDETMTIYDRNNIKLPQHKYINLTIKKKAKANVKKKVVKKESRIEELNIDDINKKFKKIIQLLDFKKQIKKNNLDEINYKWIAELTTIKYQFAIDRLTIDERAFLLHHILTKDTLTPEDKIVYEYYKRNFIHKINGEYKIDEMSEEKPLGFVLFNKITPVAYILDGNKIIVSSSVLEQIKDYLNKYKETKTYKSRYENYSDIWTYNDSGQFKVITKESNDPIKTSYRGNVYIRYGMNCELSQSGNHSYEDLVKLIELIDNPELNKIKQDIIDKKFTNKYMCYLFELICRKYTSDDLIYHLKEDSLFMKLDILNIVL